MNGILSLKDAQLASAEETLRALAHPPGPADMEAALQRVSKRLLVGRAGPAVIFANSPLEARKLFALVGLVVSSDPELRGSGPFLSQAALDAALRDLHASVSDREAFLKLTRPPLTLAPDETALIALQERGYRRSPGPTQAEIALVRAANSRCAHVLADAEAVPVAYRRQKFRTLRFRTRARFNWELLQSLAPLDAAERAGLLSKSSGKLLADLKTIATGAFLMFELMDIVIAVRPPIRVRLDAAGRLHDETGPALRFHGGATVYALEGAVLPKGLALGERRLGAAQINLVQNPVMRRLLMRRYKGLRGASACDAWLADMGAVEIDRDPRHGQLFSMRRRAYLRVECLTKRDIHHLEVPPWMMTSRAARAWTFGLPESVLDSAVET